jgi:hypothetical protein
MLIDETAIHAADPNEGDEEDGEGEEKPEEGEE